jgi:hypothetical protein
MALTEIIPDQGQRVTPGWQAECRQWHIKAGLPGTCDPVYVQYSIIVEVWYARLPHTSSPQYYST